MTKELITTRLRNSHQKLGIDSIFLGAWAINSAEKERLKNPTILNYHWDDRDKLFEDYKYLQNIYEKISVHLYEKLNSIHSTNHSYKFWRMVVGPWLNQFIQMYFDRWFMLNEAVKKYHQLEIQSFILDSCDVVTNDMFDFENKSIEDLWNSSVYYEIAASFGKNITLSKISLKNEELKSQNKKTKVLIFLRIISKKNLLGKIFEKFVKFILGLGQKIYSKNEIFLMQTFMGIKSECELQIKLGQVPKIWSSLKCPTFSIDHKLRNWVLSVCDEHLEKNAFESLLLKKIANHIPKAYLEGYEWITKQVNEVKWPKNPNAIFTSNAFYSDDFFKVWAANKVESNGSRYVIGQHGGGYGVWRFDSCLLHELEIADSFVSWGWKKNDSSKIAPLGNLKCYGRQLKPYHSGKALLVFTSLPRYSYRLYSVPVASVQMERYFNDHVLFLNTLHENVRSQLIIRTYGNDYGYEEKRLLSEKFKNVNYDNEELGIYDVLTSMRICVCTYNATTYLETMYFNFPTIAYWDKNYSEIQPEVEHLFELIRSVGILHDSPESAAFHLNNIWNNIDGWWHDKKVQNARKIFCENFSRLNELLLDDIARLLKIQGNTYHENEAKNF